MPFAMPDGLRTMGREGMRIEGMLCHKRVSDGHIGVGQARWNSKKVSGLYNAWLTSLSLVVGCESLLSSVQTVAIIFEK